MTIWRKHMIVNGMELILQTKILHIDCTEIVTYERKIDPLKYRLLCWFFTFFDVTIDSFLNPST